MHPHALKGAALMFHSIITGLEHLFLVLLLCVFYPPLKAGASISPTQASNVGLFT